MIDKLVYKLHRLTYDEVKIIELEFALTEQEYKYHILFPFYSPFLTINTSALKLHFFIDFRIHFNIHIPIHKQRFIQRIWIS
jgi:hypothetical protein